jgi:hypothetical protein
MTAVSTEDNNRCIIIKERESKGRADDNTKALGSARLHFATLFFRTLPTVELFLVLPFCFLSSFGTSF